MIDDRVVVVRHAAGSRRYHLLPGGGVDYRETIEAALVREVREETGLVIEVGHPLFVSDTIDPAGSRHVINITMSARVDAGELTQTPEDPRVEAVETVTLAELAQLDLRPPMAHAIISRAMGSSDAPAQYLGALFTE